MHLIRCNAAESYGTNTHFRRCIRLTDTTSLDEFNSNQISSVLSTQTLDSFHLSNSLSNVK